MHCLPLQQGRIANENPTDLQHAVFVMLLKGKLGLAPLENPQSVLDIGTGTGIWAIEFGKRELPLLSRRKAFLLTRLLTF